MDDVNVRRRTLLGALPLALLGSACATIESAGDTRSPADYTGCGAGGGEGSQPVFVLKDRRGVT